MLEFGGHSWQVLLETAPYTAEYDPSGHLEKNESENTMDVGAVNQIALAVPLLFRTLYMGQGLAYLSRCQADIDNTDRHLARRNRECTRSLRPEQKH